MREYFRLVLCCYKRRIALAITDRVKIIDSDDGRIIYNAIVERYKDGISVDTIISRKS